MPGRQLWYTPTSSAAEDKKSTDRWDQMSMQENALKSENLISGYSQLIKQQVQVTLQDHSQPHENMVQWQSILKSVHSDVSVHALHKGCVSWPRWILVAILHMMHYECEHLLLSHFCHCEANNSVENAPIEIWGMMISGRRRGSQFFIGEDADGDADDDDEDYTLLLEHHRYT